MGSRLIVAATSAPLSSSAATTRVTPTSARPIATVLPSRCGALHLVAGVGEVRAQVGDVAADLLGDHVAVGNGGRPGRRQLRPRPVGRRQALVEVGEGAACRVASGAPSRTRERR